MGMRTAMAKCLVTLSTCAALGVGAHAAHRLPPLIQRATRPAGLSVLHASGEVGVAGDAMTGAKRRELRALAGRLQAHNKLRVINVLGVDFTADFLCKIGAALDDHELVKLRMRDVGSKKEVKVVAEEIAAGHGAAVAQVLGHTALLYRPRAPEVGAPIIEFGPDGKARVMGELGEVEDREAQALDAFLSSDSCGSD